MSRLFQDLRYSLRLLVKDRGFSITALLTLAICIAANTAIFSVVRSVLLKPLPIPASEQLVLLYNSYPNAGAPRVGAAVPDLFDRIDGVPAMVEQALLRREGMTLGDADGAERLTTLRATTSFYQLARMQPVQGRIFSDAEGEPGANAVTILGHGFWQRKYAGDASVIGRQIRLNGNQLTIVGIAPQEFTFLWDDIDLYTPAAFTPEQRTENRHSNNWQMVGRLAPDATVDLAQQQVDAVNALNDERFPEFKQVLADAGFSTVVVSLQDDLVRDIRAVLYLLWGGVLFVLLIGCVNLANLVMVRSSARAREMATRHAIGGDLGRLARQLLTETTVLSLVGSAIGVLVGWWSLRWITTLDLDRLPRAYEIQLDMLSVAVILGLTLTVGLAIGLAPVIGLWRMNLNSELREGGRGGTAGRRAHLVRRTLATAQVAIAFVLLIGAGLLLASFRAVLGLDFGFEPARVQTATFNLPAAAYADPPALATFSRRALESLRSIPGVEGVGMTDSVPFGGNVSNSVILAEGYVMQPGESLLAPSRITVSDGYFGAMNIKVVSGREFNESDTADSTTVVVIDERLAQKYWPDQDAVGRRLYSVTDPENISAITDDTQFFNIVGVVREVQMFDPRADFTPVGTYYFPQSQQPSRGMAVAVRTRTDDPTVTNSVRQKIAQLDPELPLFRVQPMQQFIDDAMTGRRVPMYVAMAFAAVGLFLSAIGIYGVLAYGVAQRRRELGLRMALGGTAGSVFNLVLTDGVKISVIGLVVGFGGAYFVGRLMEAQLFNVSPMDPVVLALVAVTLLAVALCASVIPSWRATKIDPIVVLSK